MTTINPSTLRRATPALVLIALIAAISLAWAQQVNHNSSRSNRSPSEGIMVPGSGADMTVLSKIDAKITITIPGNPGQMPTDGRQRYERMVDFLLAQTKSDLMKSWDAQNPPPTGKGR